jgi:hypothetical protein
MKAVWNFGCFLLTIYFTVGSVKCDQIQNNCYTGAYIVKSPPFGECSGFRHCEVGHYCQNGLKASCNAGSFGSSVRLSNSTCSGLCSAGYFCPAGSVSATSHYCGNSSVYCPIGSGAPLIAPAGYFTTDESGNDYTDSETRRTDIRVCPVGSYCVLGVKHVCDPGRFGVEAGASSALCTDECPEGWYCPAASTAPFAHPCSSSPREYCPKGADHPLRIEQGFFATRPHRSTGGGFGASEVCPRGSFCLDGVRRDCPAGRYGGAIQMHNSSCSGECTAGYYCPAGSISRNQVQCSSSATYCPAGSAQPLSVSVGHYSTGFSSDLAIDAQGRVSLEEGDNVFSGLARTSQTRCESGSFCLRDGTHTMNRVCII